MNIIGGPPPPRDKRGRIIPIPDLSGAIVHNVPGDRHGRITGKSGIQVPEGEILCYNPDFRKKAWIIFSIFVTIAFISCIVLYFVIFHGSSELGGNFFQSLIICSNKFKLFKER